MKDLTIVPMKLDEENAFVSKWHRHHAPVPGCKFCVGVAKGDAIVGVAINFPLDTLTTVRLQFR
jgi:hypothetical protein